MGLCYRTSRWTDRLWAEHLDISAPARGHVEDGILRQGAPFAGFASDLHARLYLPSDPPAAEGEHPAWASQLHEQASQLAEWQRLRQMCARNGFAAGIATEALLDSLLPLVPQRPKQQPGSDGGGGKGNGAGSPTEGPGASQDASAGGQAPGAGQGLRASPEATRAALRRAAREATEAVGKAEAATEGMATACGWSHTSGGPVVTPGPADLSSIRAAYGRIQSSHKLRRIAELAGRLERLACVKARSEVRPGVGEVHGVDQGSDLARLLPSELAALRHSRLRLAALAKLVERRALCYGMKGQEPQARGPIVVLLDESSSMTEHGKETWAKAVCLALLSTATRQKRAWHLVAFNQRIRREVEVPAGRATPDLIAQALDVSSHGNTDFDAPVMRAVEVIRKARTMKRADVVIITDGQSGLESATVDAAQKLTREQGVSWYAVGVGPEAAYGLRSLAPIATTSVAVRDAGGDQDPILPVVNLSEVA